MARHKKRKARRRYLRKTSKLAQLKRYQKAFLIALGVFVISIVWIDIVVRAKFEGKKWALPARVYARALELYVGLQLKPEHFEYELRGLEYRFTSALMQPGDIVQQGQGYQIYSRAFQFWDKQEPAQMLRLKIEDDRVTELSDHQGVPLAVVRLDPQQIGGIYPTHMEDRQLVRLADIPPLLGEALIAVEDRDFSQHFGVSLKAIARAAWANLRAQKIVQGGSTLTQQLVKNFYLNHQRDFSRKLLEAVMSVLLELHYSKVEILETYLNEVYLGQSGPRAIHGFALASQHYFRKPLDKLALPQLALLVGLVKGASFYNPWRYPERAQQRRNLVLRIMADEGLISSQQMQQASNAAVEVVSASKRRLHAYPGFIDLVKRQLRRDYLEEDLRSEGLRIFTTLSPVAQQIAETALSGRIDTLEQAHLLQPQTLQGAVVVTSVGSGEVMAVVGGRQAQFAGFNRALDARRSIGSLIKPAVYLTALRRPDEYTLMTKINDGPVSVGGADGSVWQPRNFSNEAHGDVPLYIALTHSYNQATARLGMQLGLASVFETVRKLGVEQDLLPVPSVLLGAVSLSPLDVAGMYHTIAAEGVYTPLRAIRAVLTVEGQQLKRYPLEVQQRFSADSIHLLQYAMQSSMRRGTGSSAYQRLPDTLALAGKTGTTNDLRDSWFAGFSGDHLAVVWVGRDDNGKTPLTGTSGALQIWTDMYTKLAARSLAFEKPETIAYQWVDGETGLLSGENCRGAEWIPFVIGTEPRRKGQCEWVENPMIRWFRRIW